MSSTGLLSQAVEIHCPQLWSLGGVQDPSRCRACWEPAPCRWHLLAVVSPSHPSQIPSLSSLSSMGPLEEVYTSCSHLPLFKPTGFCSIRTSSTTMSLDDLFQLMIQRPNVPPLSTTASLFLVDKQMLGTGYPASLTSAISWALLILSKISQSSSFELLTGADRK